MISARAPRRRHRLLRGGGMVKCYRATIDCIRDAQHEGLPTDVLAMEKTAAKALDWLANVVCDEAMRLRMERAVW
jgi:hypothetical protein